MSTTQTKAGNAADEKKITPRATDYSQWYLDVIAAADLADYSPVKGCMVIKPNGYAIWERIQAWLDEQFKATGVRNAYFPLFIPQRFLEREKAHVEGFAPEVAVVTHAGGKKLDEPLVVRPTSETIIGEMFSQWVKSYRDLPLLINQWANVVRWELRTRPFLRTTEFLWQEGHTVHATAAGAEERTQQMLDVYRTLAEEVLAIPVLAGLKSEAEKFAGADATYSIEAMMQDGKALQFATSHNLGQNFSKSFHIQYLDEHNTLQYGWQTSWGLSTRSIGGLIMVHSDDKGLVLPPKIAPVQVVITTVTSAGSSAEIDAIADQVASTLRSHGVRIHVDNRDLRPGEKYYAWEKQGVPVRLELGPKDVAAKSVMAVRRDTGEKTKMTISSLAKAVPKLLDTMQHDLFQKAKTFRDQHTVTATTWDEFTAAIEGGNFVEAAWDETGDAEAKIKEETGATIRSIPLDQPGEAGTCVLTGRPTKRRAVFARAY